MLHLNLKAVSLRQEDTGLELEAGLRSPFDQFIRHKAQPKITAVLARPRLIVGAQFADNQCP